MAFNPSSLQPILVGFTNCYPIDTGQGLALIDTSNNTDTCWEQLTTDLEQRGYHISHVRWVLLTHGHLDHSGLAHRLRAVSGAEVLAHQQEAAFLREGNAQWRTHGHLFEQLFLEHGVPKELLEWYQQQDRRASWRSHRKNQPNLFQRTPERGIRWDLIRAARGTATAAVGTPEEEDPPQRHDQEEEERHAWQPAPIEPDRTFSDGEVLELGHLRLRVVHTPGHTPGHACFYHEASGVLFTGDHILKRVVAHRGVYFQDNRYEQRAKSLPNYFRSLQKVRDLPAQRILPAHEGEVSDLTYAVDRIIAFHERRARSTLQALQHGRSTAFEVLPFLFPNLRAMAFPAALQETVGHLDLLEERGEARSAFRDGLRRYWPVS